MDKMTSLKANKLLPSTNNKSKLFCSHSETPCIMQLIFCILKSLIQGRILARVAALQWVAVRRSTGNDVSGHYFRRYFLFFSFSFLRCLLFS